MLEIKSFHSADVFDLDNWAPHSPEDVYLSLEFEVGEVGSAESVVYSTCVATGEGVRAHRDKYKLNAVQLKRTKHYLVPSFDWVTLKIELKKIVSENTHEQLQRRFHWEYE